MTTERLFWKVVTKDETKKTNIRNKECPYSGGFFGLTIDVTRINPRFVQYVYAVVALVSRYSVRAVMDVRHSENMILYLDLVTT